MREILFRGKHVDNGEWIFGHYVHQYGADMIYLPDGVDGEFGFDYQHIIPETVGQYTGLTDKNGKKIFEGDIVRADDYIFVIQYGKCGGTPNADNHGYMGFYLEALSEGTKLCAKYGLRDDICYFTDIEVIDNIHDNLLLLKGGAE